MTLLCITTERLAVPTSIGSNAGAFIQSVDDSANQRTDRNRLVFVEVNRSGFAVGFKFFAFHRGDYGQSGVSRLA